MEPLSVGMYLSEIMLSAGPDGAHLVHPLFVVWQAETPEPDPIDRFAGLDLALAAGQSQMIGGGTAVFVEVPPDVDAEPPLRARRGVGRRRRRRRARPVARRWPRSRASAQPGLSATA